jgi:hypothetical protein
MAESLRQLVADVQEQKQRPPPLSREVLAEALTQEHAEQRQRAQQRRRRHLPPVALEKQQVILEPPDQLCPVSGAPRDRIGQEVTTEYDYLPAKLIIREIVRPKYGRCGQPCCQGVSIAPLPLRLVPQTLPTGTATQGLHSGGATPRPLSQSPALWLAMKRRAQALRADPRVLPQSSLGKAVNYFLNEYTALVGYLRDGRFEIDSNLVENYVRPSAVGKRRWLFIGHPDAGWRRAVIYTLIQSCRRYGINPQAYFTDVLHRLPAMTVSTSLSA